MQVRLDYGKSGLDVQVPDANLVGPLTLAPVAPLADPAATLADALRVPIAAAPLEELARGKRNVCILICDITRPVPNQLLLDAILPTLHRGGIPREAVLILVATGLHRPSTTAEREELVGPSIAAEYRIEDHDGKQLSEHAFLGTSPRGVPIWIDRRYVEAELKIATGLIEPHLMAGFSGGRKLICPGIAALETVKVWHGPELLEHPRADCGILEDNPVHEESTRIARIAGCDFIVNVTLDAQRRITSIVAGDLEQAFAHGVAQARRIATAPIASPCEIVVTSSAGYPLDTTFYQAIKGLTAVLPIVRQGGTIIIAAGLADGVGSPEFQRLFSENASLDQFTRRIMSEGYFVMDQWQLQELAKVRRKAGVTVVSDGLPADTLGRLFVDSAPSVEQAIDDALARHGSQAKIAVVPKGPYVLPILAPR